MDKIREAADLILKSKKVFALTGAGISTDSGIPDFRSSSGYYSKSISTERYFFLNSSLVLFLTAEIISLVNFSLERYIT